jgi:hypothetical protein
MKDDSDIVLSNSIVWGNHPKGIIFAGSNTPSITYCDLQDGWFDTGNTNLDPLFAQMGYWTEPDDSESEWVGGDYHLKSQEGRWDIQTETWITDDVTSPCIDAGNPTDPVESEPVPHGDIINLGAYGGTSQASKSPVGL